MTPIISYFGQDDQADDSDFDSTILVKDKRQPTADNRLGAPRRRQKHPSNGLSDVRQPVREIRDAQAFVVVFRLMRSRQKKTRIGVFDLGKRRNLAKECLSA